MMGKLFHSIDGFIVDENKIFHGFFGRQGGESAGLHASLNCGAGSDDDQEKIAANRAIVAKAAGCGDSKNLLSLYQVHSDICVIVKTAADVSPKPQADAFVTDMPGLALGVLTADCTPVLFYGEKDAGAPVIGAAHAGWGGALKGIMESTLEQMEALGAVKSTIRAAIGPCIAQKSYEVQDAFADDFLKEDDENERFFKSAQKSEHLMFDLSGYCAFKLYKQGIRDVFMADMDTYSREDEFFSYRRATHRQEADYGRQISVISIKG